jgi:hypothetical protein
MANFLEDDLSGTNPETLDGSNLDPEVGDANSWVRLVTTGGTLEDLTINGAGSGVFSTSSNSACYNSTTPPSANYQVVLTILNGNDADDVKVGMFLRALADGTNGDRYQVEWDNTANLVRIGKVAANNVLTSLDTVAYSGPTAGTNFELKGTVSGGATTTIKAYVDGVEVLSCDDSSSPLTAAGKCGLSIRGGSSGATQILNVTAAELVGSDGEEALTGSASTGAQTAPTVNFSVPL